MDEPDMQIKQLFSLVIRLLNGACANWLQVICVVFQGRRATDECGGQDSLSDISVGSEYLVNAQMLEEQGHAETGVDVAGQL